MRTAKLLLVGLASTLATSACVLDADSSTAPAAAPETAEPTLPRGSLVAKGGELPGTSYVWTDRTEVFIPRMLPGVADQPARGRVLVYGGWQENGVRFDTWEWDGVGWIRRQPLHDPGTRVGPAVAYDDARSRVILVGGAADFLPSFRFADTSSTWEWDGEDWAKLSVLHSPPPTAISSGVWDPDRQRMLVFGGFRPPGIDPAKPDQAPGSDELWAFDGSDWQQIPRVDPWPPAAGLNGMTYDRARHRLVLFVGYPYLDFTDGNPTFGKDANGNPNFSPIGTTWEWDGSTWSQTGKASDNAALNAGASLFYDPTQNQVGMLLTELDVIGKKVVQGYRTYQGASWPLIANAPDTGNRVIVNTAWSSANGAPLSFGGVLLEASLAVSTTVARDEAMLGNPWTVQPPALQMPAIHHASAVTEKDGTVTVFGGQLGNDFTNDTYSWTGGRWTAVTAENPPPPRAYAAMTRFGGASVLFGGQVPDGSFLSDTWTYNPVAHKWSSIDPAQAPSPRASAVLVELTDGAYLFGGTVDGGARSDETWRFHDATWSPLSLDPTPTSRNAPCAASLPDHASAMLAGGNKVADVWTLATTWTRNVESTGIGVRNGCGMTFDSTAGQMLVLGGTGAPGTQDLWSMTPTIDGVTNARNVEARGELPPRRYGHVFVDNPVSGGTMVFGGTRNDTETGLADTWQLRTYGQACQDDATCKKGAFCTEGVCCEAKSCGPCETCAPGGLCVPRGAGPQPGCDGNYACNADGRCRLGTDQPCADNDACAGGACTKPPGADAGQAGVCCGIDGCAVACIDDAQLRNAAGELTSCAPYKCVGSACTTSCASVGDCATGLICDENSKCVTPTDTASDDTSSCGCKVAGTKSPSTLGMLGLACLFGLASWRRLRARRDDAA